MYDDFNNFFKVRDGKNKYFWKKNQMTHNNESEFLSLTHNFFKGVIQKLKHTQVLFRKIENWYYGEENRNYREENRYCREENRNCMEEKNREENLNYREENRN